MATDAVNKASEYRRKREVVPQNNPVSDLVDPVMENITGSSVPLAPPLPSTQEQLDPVVPNPTPKTEDIVSAVKTDPVVARGMVKHFQGVSGQKLTKKQEDKAVLLLNNEQTKDSPGISTTFVTALLGFLPTLVGAAFGGSEGGAMGAQVGLNSIKQYGTDLKDEAALKYKTEQDKLQNVREDTKVKLQALRDEASTKVESAKLGIEQQKLGVEREKLAATQSTEGRKLTETESKAAEQGSRAENALNAYENAKTLALKSGPSPTGYVAGGQRMLSSILPSAVDQAPLSPHIQEMDQAGEALINAVLVDESGSAISDKEYVRKARNLVDKAGDTPLQSLEKAIARQLAVSTLNRRGIQGMGKSGIDNMIVSAQRLRDLKSRTATTDELSKMSNEELRVYRDLKSGRL